MSAIRPIQDTRLSHNTKTSWQVLILTTFISLILGACSSFQKNFIKELNDNEALSHSFTGFVLLDPQSNQYLMEYQADKYFTPASNTKLFTFYAAEKILDDSIKAFEYEERGDTIRLWGTGDPSLFHPDLPTSGVGDFLEGKTVILVNQTFEEPSYGPGWAWDDYQGSYQREKSSFPVYGNAISVHYDSLQSSLKVHPPFFKDSVVLADTVSGPLRDINKNYFYFRDYGDTVSIPFKSSPQLSAQMLSERFQKQVLIEDSVHLSYDKAFYSVHKDSLLKPLLRDSDNFIAEQLILQCSWELFREYDSQRTLDLIIDSMLQDLPQAPIWVDGSGLSRYNMFTPRSISVLLKNIYYEVPRDRLFHLLPAGGVSGTIEDYYRAETPYIFAKTGTLRHNHNLSGYLVTRSGKVLIFSFMHNHFPNGSSPIKKEMERLLWQIHLNY